MAGWLAGLLLMRRRFTSSSLEELVFLGLFIRSSRGFQSGVGGIPASGASLQQAMKSDVDGSLEAQVVFATRGGQKLVGFNEEDFLVFLATSWKLIVSLCKHLSFRCCSSR